MPESDDCPTSEELAALVEGSRLDGRWRDLVAHLRRCSACYTVFVEVLRLRRASRRGDDSDEGRGPGGGQR